MEPTPETVHTARSPRWMGHPRKYQLAAQDVYQAEVRRALLPWSLIRTQCSVPMCLDFDCMVVLTPRAIRYPAGVCTYCGEPATGRDHLLPKPLTGAALRHEVLTVTSCADCNGRINDFPSACVTGRRERAHASIRRTKAKTLAIPLKTPAELRAMGPTLRSAAIAHNRKREWLLTRLSWPDDPYYDLRAFQRSGIDDPVALGLIRGADAA
jgi:hypothetical protein